MSNDTASSGESLLSKPSFIVLFTSLAFGYLLLNPDSAILFGDCLALLASMPAATLRLAPSNGAAFEALLAELRKSGYVQKIGNEVLRNPPVVSKDVSSSGALAKEFAGARVLVVGGSRGIGRGIATVLSKLRIPISQESGGLRVITVGRSKLGADEPKTERVNIDLASLQGCESLVGNLKIEMGKEKFTHVVFTLGAWPDWKQPASPDGFDRVLQIDIISRSKIFFGLQAAGLLMETAQITSVLASAQTDHGLGIKGDGMKQRFQKYAAGYKYSILDLGAILMTACKTNDVFLHEAAKLNPAMTFLGVFPGIVKTEVSAPTLGSLGRVIFALYPGAQTLEESGYRHVNMMWRARQLRYGGVVAQQGLPANLFFFDHKVTVREGLPVLLDEPSYGKWLWDFLQGI